jgi:hypothetical protein
MRINKKKKIKLKFKKFRKLIKMRIYKKAKINKKKKIKLKFKKFR